MFFAPQLFHFRFGLESVARRAVGENFSVAHRHVSLGVLGDVQFMGDHDDGDAVVVQSLEGVYDFDVGLSVEIAHRFVGKKQKGIHYQRTGQWPPVVVRQRVGYPRDPLDPSGR